MKTSIATVCLSGRLEEKLEAVAAAGFRGVEIFEADPLAYSGTPADLVKQMRELGLQVTTFQPFRDFEGMTGLQRGRTFDRAERKFDVMQEIGCGLLLVCSRRIRSAE
jgi:3-dehydroshikimate dehydratase